MLELFLIGIFSIISCFLFGKLQLKATVLALSNSYKSQYQLILDNSIEDELKQKQIFKHITFQLRHLGLLILKIITLVSPFLLFYFLEFLGLNINSGKLVETKGITVSLVTILIFVVFKNSYGKLFQHK